MVVGTTPSIYSGLKNKNKNEKNLELNFPIKIEKDLVLLIRDLTNSNKIKRPTILDILTDPWVKRMESETAINLSFIYKIKKQKNSKIVRKPTYEEFRKITTKIGRRSESRNSLAT